MDQSRDFVKKWKFWNCFFLGKTSPEKVFGDVLYSSQVILDKENVDLWVVKKLKFSTGVNQYILQKLEYS